jgi:hypothetical protein
MEIQFVVTEEGCYQLYVSCGYRSKSYPRNSIFIIIISKEKILYVQKWPRQCPSGPL